MTTNTILYPKKSAGNSGVGGLLEFLDGPDAESHDQSRGENFDTLVESVALAKSLGSSCANHTVTAQLRAD